MTRRTERYRPPYGRNEVEEPRQCCFIGTTNQDTYLKDETGGRRFWPLKVGQIDLERLKQDRDQLFAEAVVLYRAGERWWPDAEFEATHIRPAQNARYSDDPWAPAKEAYVRRLPYPASTTLGDILTCALGFERPKEVGTRDQNRVKAVLTRLGWVRNEHKTNGHNRWEPGPTWTYTAEGEAKDPF